MSRTVSISHILVFHAYDDWIWKHRWCRIIKIVSCFSPVTATCLNSAKKRSSTGAFRSNADHETPVAIYIAFLIHSKTRSEDLVHKLHSLGLCISYDRLTTLSTYLGNSVIDQFEKDGLVCPTSLRTNLFTTHAVDNINHDPSSRTAKDSWHGTAISACQHRANKDDGSIRPVIEVQKDKLKTDTETAPCRIHYYLAISSEDKEYHQAC